MFLGVISSACVNNFAIHELNTKANTYLNNGEIDKAISRLEASVDLDGNIYESRYNLAVAYIRKGECEKALENIEVALNLIKNEPAVLYTHGIASIRVADKIFEKPNEKGEIKPVKFDDKNLEKQSLTRFVELYKNANDSFEKYVKLVPNAEDAQGVFDLIEKNNEIIKEKESKLATF